MRMTRETCSSYKKIGLSNNLSHFLKIINTAIMSFPLADPIEEYSKRDRLKQDDVQAVFEWLKKQPHLPQLTEAAKTAIDTYFTLRTRWPDLFKCPSEEIVRNTLSIESMIIYPRQTPEGYVILAIKLLDYRPEKYININHLKLAAMVVTLYLHQRSPTNGIVFLFDSKGATLSHLARVNLMAAFLQEAAPIRVKSAHFINVVPLTEKIVAVTKPFLKQEIFNLIHIHSGSFESLYKFIPKEYLPEEYGGELPARQDLHDKKKGWKHSV